MNRIALLGASRGLGWALYSQLAEQNKETCFFLSSRKITEKTKSVSNTTILEPQDFSKLPVQSGFLKDLQKFKPTHLVYMAGGGPYGAFASKKWSDHVWSLNTTFMYPAELLHQILSHPTDWSDLQQIICVGSAIAENDPDPYAASYAAAKHALKGLISTLQQEGAAKPELVLFSPGYMQTELLPQSSWPRQQGLAEDVTLVADRLIALIEKNNQR